MTSFYYRLIPVLSPLAKKIFFGIALLGSMLHCKPKEIICTHDCCDATWIEYKYIQEIKNAEADYANGGFWLKVPVGEGIHGIMVCDLTLDKIADFSNTFDPRNIPNLPFAYRISGTIYENITETTFGATPIYNINLISAQKVK